MTDDRIDEIPSFSELRRNLRDLSLFKEALPVLKPVFKSLGVDVDRIDSTLDEAGLESLSREVEGLVTAPDRFNDVFGSRGWIMYESMNLKVVKAAVAKAEAGDIDGAEADLVAYYDPETVGFLLQRMQAVEAFRPRMRLAFKALEDYTAGRYHASVPVILALTDGLVNDVYILAHGVARGLSSDETELVAWDSIAAHSKGLERLANLLRKGRRTTRTEEITFPYRHGILHGMDLGYDNAVVAAKTWAILFAVREWALKAERGELEAPPEEPEPSLRDIAQQYRRTQEMKRRLSEWRPREIDMGVDIPSSGDPSDYEPDSPERALVEFMHAWRSRNYGRMAEVLRRVASGGPEHPGRIRGEFEGIELEDFELLAVDDGAAAMTDITLLLTVDRFGQKSEERKKIRLVRIDETGSPAIRDVEQGEWTIGNRGVLLGPGDRL